MIQNKLNFFFKHQIWHIGGAIIFFYIAFQFVDFNNNTNTFIGINALCWFTIAMSMPLIHQAYVWICWRSELCWKSISNTIGFKGYVIIFFILIILRLSAIVLCFVDYGSLYTPGWFAWILALILFIHESSDIVFNTVNWSILNFSIKESVISEYSSENTPTLILYTFHLLEHQ